MNFIIPIYCVAGFGNYEIHIQKNMNVIVKTATRLLEEGLFQLAISKKK